ncbi:MAG TPA: hypothetical protein VFL17_12965, partial [Anaerolineae bacterium]|nr:hypothetical protein [Anaerolineae bacterium]
AANRFDDFRPATFAEVGDTFDNSSHMAYRIWLIADALSDTRSSIVTHINSRRCCAVHAKPAHKMVF